LFKVILAMIESWLTAFFMIFERFDAIIQIEQKSFLHIQNL